MTIAQHVAEALVGLGIKRVYGLPGEDHMALLDAFQAAGLDYCTAFNESSAVIMAATDAQFTGLPGVAMLSLAPGVSNGVNGLLNTYLDEIPLLLISGQHQSKNLPFTVRQGFNIEQMITPMTKWRARLTAGMDVPSVIGKAVDEALSGRPGPVYLEIPDAVAVANGTASEAARSAGIARMRSRWVDAAPSPEPASPAAVEALAVRLANARRPALVLGGRRRRVTPATLRAFVEAFRMPSFTTSRQLGAINADSPFHAGTFLNGRLEKDLLDQADLVIAIDPESFDYYNKPWTFAADVVAITTPGFTEWSNPIAEQIVADPESLLSALLGRSSPSSEWSAADVAAYREGLRVKVLPPDAGFSVAHAVDAALRAWPRDGYITADAGFSKPLIVMLADQAEPDRFFASNALSTMGYSIPAAVAARRAGARPVLSFMGDGSLLMRATELMVSAGDGAPAVFIAVMDRALTQIEVKQERRTLATVGVSLPPVMCASLADAFGIDGVDVDNADDLRAAIGKGLGGSRPMLIGAHVDPAPSRVLFDLLRG